MEISQSLVCTCNNKLYKSQAALKAHHKTNIHTAWESPQMIKNLEIRSTRLENENGHLRRLNIILMEKIYELEKKCIKCL